MWTVTGLFDQDARTLLVAAVFEGGHRAKDEESQSGGMGRFCVTVDASSTEEAEQQARDIAEGTVPERDDDIVLTFTRGQVNAWADRRLNDDELEQLEEALPNSTLPTVVGMVADSILP